MSIDGRLALPALNSHPRAVDVDAVIARLGEQFTPAESAIAERILRDYGGTIPDQQLIEEVGLAVAIHRRQQRG